MEELFDLLQEWNISTKELSVGKCLMNTPIQYFGQPYQGK